MSSGVARKPHPATDPLVRRLRRFFAGHEVWAAAAALLDEGATSRVTFSHLPDEEWTLQRRRGRTVLARGRARDPDLAFHFTPGAIERITAVRGGIAAFAIELFSAALDDDPQRSLRVEVLAPFARLVRRGYLRLLWAGGAPLLTFGARHGVRSIPDLERVVDDLARRGPASPRTTQPKARRTPRRQ